jgi:hypothetical protein
MAIFDYAMCHNLRPYKMNNYNGWWKLILLKKSKYPHNATCQILMD